MSHLQWLHLLEPQLRRSRLAGWADWLVPPPPSRSLSPEMAVVVEAVAVGTVTGRGGREMEGCDRRVDGGLAVGEGSLAVGKGSLAVGKGGSLAEGDVAVGTLVEGDVAVGNPVDGNVAVGSGLTDGGVSVGNLTAGGGGTSPDAPLSVDLTPSAASSSLSSWVIDPSPSASSSSSAPPSSSSSLSYSSGPPSQCEARASDDDVERRPLRTGGSGSGSGGGRGSGSGSSRGSGCSSGGGSGGGGGGATERVLEAVLREFDRAERAVSDARKALTDRGFSEPNPGHVLQFIRSAREEGEAEEEEEAGAGEGDGEKRVAMRGTSDCCVFLASAALSVEGGVRGQHEGNVPGKVSGTVPGEGMAKNVPRNSVAVEKSENGGAPGLEGGERGGGGATAAAGSEGNYSTTGTLAVSRDECERELGDSEEDEDEGEDGWFGAVDGDKEAVGSWGFRDSGFSLESDRADGGNPYVVMRGNRWVEGGGGGLLICCLCEPFDH